MNLGHLWISLVRITPCNNRSAEREILPYMVGNSPVLSYMVIGQPHWSWMLKLVKVFD